MSFVASDLKLAFPVNAGPDANRNLNFGGAIQTPRLYFVNDTAYNCVPDITRAIVGPAGTTGTWNIYFCMYLVNSHASVTITAGKFHILKQPTNPNCVGAIGLVGAKNASAVTIPNRTTAPSGVSFSSTRLFGVVVPIDFPGDKALAPGEYFPIWIRFSGPKGTLSIPLLRFLIREDFTRPA